MAASLPLLHTPQGRSNAPGVPPAAAPTHSATCTCGTQTASRTLPSTTSSTVMMRRPGLAGPNAGWGGCTQMVRGSAAYLACACCPDLSLPP